MPNHFKAYHDTMQQNQRINKHVLLFPHQTIHLVTQCYANASSPAFINTKSFQRAVPNFHSRYIFIISDGF